MAQISVRINGRSYDVACDDGQESRLLQLADYVNERVGEIAGAVGQIGEQRLLVMASLLIADELADARTSRTADSAQSSGMDQTQADELADGMETLAARIETVAQKLTIA
ncbi:cell division protein ZapA [Thalassospira sp.]|uniref:cell division protein ZapA n=1 Tax=Thalassospira sp. TaxID=1912094 RepID=UPI002732C9DF|nr:cell division protein ZapA [Thalassospira sp.]MDP2697140.1 cell division protein ZapA [Thalassospira sp.]